MSIFSELLVYHDIDSRTAAMNMAVDEALLECAAKPLIRFYQWNHPALSFGYSGKFEEVADQERDIVRRWTGGGIVFHGQDLTYSIVIPANHTAFRLSSMSIYEKVHEAIRSALGTTVAALYEREREKDSAIAERRHDEGFCFANPVPADVLLNGQKIAGAAQRRTRLGLLQQGSIQNIDIPPLFAKTFAAKLSEECVERQLNDELVKRARAISDQKYGTVCWLRKR
jgi:lipoate-protein ligase A